MCSVDAKAEHSFLIAIQVTTASDCVSATAVLDSCSAQWRLTETAPRLGGHLSLAAGPLCTAAWLQRFIPLCIRTSLPISNCPSCWCIVCRTRICSAAAHAVCRLRQYPDARSPPICRMHTGAGQVAAGAGQVAVVVYWLRYYFLYWFFARRTPTAILPLEQLRRLLPCVDSACRV